MTTTNLIELVDAYAKAQSEYLLYKTTGKTEFNEARAAIVAAIEAQAKQIEALEKTGNEWYEAHNKKRIQLAKQAKQIEALQADAKRWNFATSNEDWAVCFYSEDGSWKPIMNYVAIDSAIDAARKGNV